MKKLAPLLLIIILMLSGCTISSVDDYYSSTEKSGDNKVTVTINCDTAVKYDSKLRTNGTILENYTVYLEANATVFDALKTACKENKIQFEYQGADSSVYIEGIDYLYEFDCGELSGWEFSVNGDFKNVGCDNCMLKDGDNVEWLYTCDLGADIGNGYTGE